ncbi:hypothetical protein [Marinobacter subterrani]|uniref:hypothetical protein n=1 Tax=Marinobacter subterrani TaxID=1658765 RepID=UPI002357E16A|nr:hypothetical protein [Marinobacter subterrani]
MSENREDQNQQSANINPLGDVFADLSENANQEMESEMNDIPEHVLAEGDGVSPEEKEATADSSESPSPGAETQEDQDDASQPDHTASTSTSDGGDVFAKAKELRKSKSLEPILLGADADLLQYNPETGEFEPINEEAAHMLAALGESADIAMVNPLSGSRMAQPVHYSREHGFQPDKTRSPVKVATNNDTERNFSMRHYANLEDRLKRVAEQRPERQQPHPIANIPSEDRDSDPQEQERAGELGGEEDRRNNNQRDPRAGDQRTTSAMLAQASGALLANTLNLSASVIDISRRSLEGLAKMTSTALNTAKGLFSKKDPLARITSIPAANQEDNLMWGLSSDYLDPNVQPANDELLATDPITPDIATNSSGALGAAAIAEKMQEFQKKQEAPAIAKAEAIRDEYKTSLSDGIHQVESALKLNEVGQIPLVSSDDFENRMKTASPDDRERAQKAMDDIVQASERYQREAQKFVLGDGESRPLDKLSGEESMKQLDAFDNLASNPGKELEEHQKKILDHLTIGGQPLTENLGSMFTAFRNMLQGAASRLGILSSANAQAQQVAGERNAEVNQPGTDTIRQS